MTKNDLYVTIDLMKNRVKYYTGTGKLNALFDLISFVFNNRLWRE